MGGTLGNSWYHRLGIRLLPGDPDSDGDIDLDDYAVLADCLEGPGVPPSPPAPVTALQCLSAFDLDTDLDVDLADFAVFEQEFAGP